MDLDEWELLPDYGFLEIHDLGGKKVFSTKHASPDPNDFKPDYFSCPSPRSHKQIIHLPPLQLDPSSSSSATYIVDQKVGAEHGDDDDTVTQVSFKKITRENEFVEMKMDSPKSRSRSPLPQIDLDSFQFERENSEVEVAGEDEKEKDDTDIGGLNIWKRSLNGIGAICSFGVAAATFCFIVLGSQQKNRRDLRFHQIYSDDDKRIKHVMTQHAAKLNGAISAMRGVPVPLARAHITVGGYYDGL